ncbi:MAG: hypothetical protein M1335_08305 [Chloroflexi bacterium]|nr:hypothetical protein [Chloroflexota bacterium]
MIEIRNLLFQPLTFQLAGGIESLHLGPRERESIPDEQVSEEMRLAAEGGFVTLSEVPDSENVPAADQGAVDDTLTDASGPEAESMRAESTSPEGTQTKKRR